MIRERRVRWYGQELQKTHNLPIREAIGFENQEERPREASKKRWRDVIKDLIKAKVAAEEATNFRDITKAAILRLSRINGTEEQKLISN
uniref:Transposase n=1 Tax=Haemonchus contortus TaxID=6289 RepID=A0A7I4Y1R6_HAECO